MPDFHRYRVPGGRYFFTANLLERRGNTLLTDRIDLLREAVRRVRPRRPFTIDAWVVLPDHLHAVWTLPPGDDDFSTRWRLIKTFFARGLPKTERLSRVRRRDGERGIWQRRFWERAVRDDEDDAAHMDYVHFNPVEHGLVAAPAEWPYSIFKSCVRRVLHPLDRIGSNVQDVQAASAADESMRRNTPAAIPTYAGWILAIVKRAADADGFQVLPRSRVVERTLAWLNRNRRLAKDFEASIASAESWIMMASVKLLSRRLARS